LKAVIDRVNTAWTAWTACQGTTLSWVASTLLNLDEALVK
jgi:hypothetical protein